MKRFFAIMLLMVFSANAVAFAAGSDDLSALSYDELIELAHDAINLLDARTEAEMLEAQTEAADDEPLVDRVLAKTYTNEDDTPALNQGGARGMLMRVQNPGAFDKITAYVNFDLQTAAATPGTLTIGVLSGTETFSGETYADQIAFAATATAALPKAASNQSVTFEFDTRVDMKDETLYIALWNSDGSGRWMSSGFNGDLYAADEAHPNYFFTRVSAASERCFLSASTATADRRGAALAFSVAENEIDQRFTNLTQRLEALERAADDANPLNVPRPDGGFCGIFNSIVCMGDSLTRGTYEHIVDGVKKYSYLTDYSYPAFMSRALGIPCVNLGIGGATAQSYLKAAIEGDYFEKNVADAYIIALGTNDVTNASSTSQTEIAHLTGDMDDIDTDDPSNTDTSTVFGAYGKIVQNIQAASPRAKIFLVTIPVTRPYSAYRNVYYNEKLRQIAAKLGCWVIDLEAHGVQQEDKEAWKAAYYTGGHLNTLGYKQLADWYMTYIDWIIRNNMAYFTQSAFAQTGYAYPMFSITAHPEDASVMAGRVTERLSVAAESLDGGTLTYQWYVNTTDSNAGGTAVPGATDASMDIPAELSEGTYYYYCGITNPTSGSKNSNPCTVAATAQPVGVYISKQPEDASLPDDAITGSVSIEASASDASEVTYQWYVNTTDSSTGGTAVPGETGASMSLPDSLTEGTYYYYCAATSATVGTAASDPCTVVVFTIPEVMPLAEYTMSGTASGDAPAAIEDASGNGNTLIVSGIASYGENGYLKVEASDDLIYCNGMNLGSFDTVTLHLKMGWSEGISKNVNRYFTIGGIHFMNSACVNNSYRNMQIETAGEKGNVILYRSPWQVGGDGEGNATRNRFKEATFDVVITDASITVRQTVVLSAETDLTYTETYTIDCAGALTELKTKGISLCNNFEGTRPHSAWVEEFTIHSGNALAENEPDTP